MGFVSYFSYPGLYSNKYVSLIHIHCVVLCDLRAAEYQSVNYVCLFGWWAGVLALQTTSLVHVAFDAICY